MFVPFRALYPECLFLIEGSPQLGPLQCLDTSCHVSANCMETLVKRVHYLFDRVEPSALMMIAYFKHHSSGESIKAGVFHKDLREPRRITVNPHGFRKFQTEGMVKQWTPTQEYLMIAALPTPRVIPVTELLKIR